jgi:hypothetical protein
MNSVFYVSEVTWANRLFVGTGSIEFVNTIKNGVMSVYVIVIKMFVLFEGAKYMKLLQCI